MYKFKKGQLVKLDYKAHLSGVNGRPVEEGKHSGKLARITKTPHKEGGKYRAKILGSKTFVNFRAGNFVNPTEEDFKRAEAFNKPKREPEFAKMPYEEVSEDLKPETKKLGFWSRLYKSIFG